MNQCQERPLDSFETALLAELRDTVSETAASQPHAQPLSVQPRSPRRAKRYSLLVAVAAATIAVALLVQGLWPTPAFAVTGRNNGEVHVRVNRLEGADRLERALAEHGITADITYLPAGKVCAPGRYTELRTPGLSLSVGADRFEVTIPPNAVGEDDTFVLSAAVVVFNDGGLEASVDFGIAHGAVAPCRIVDAP